MTASRRTGFAGVFAAAVNAGTMASSNGSATTVPSPRSTALREIAFLVTIMIAVSYCLFVGAPPACATFTGLARSGRAAARRI